MKPEVRQALLAFALACALVAVAATVARGVPLLKRNLGAAVAVVFLYVPLWFARREAKDLVDFGFHAAPIGRGLGFGLGSIAVIFPIFAIGYVGFYQIVCPPDAAAWLHQLAMPGQCGGFRGWAGAHWPHLGLEFVKLAFIQVVVIALPEELFFRGFIQGRLEQAWPPRRRLLGGGLGWALVVTSALFAAGHLIVDLDPRRLAVFFPGLLFGWMRSATGSIMAGVLAHAASNLFILVLEKSFL